MKHAPIALFVYNRPEHTLRSLDSLLQNTEAKSSELYVFSDGPRTVQDTEKVLATRNLFKELKGFKEVHLIYRDDNRGLANNIVEGVTKLLQKHDRLIVLEDDLLLSKYFLQYMNESLEKYQDTTEVCSVHGYCFPTRQPLPTNFFLKGADCWGWATWADRWPMFELNGQKLLDELSANQLTYAFDMDGIVPYTELLRGQINGKNSSWAIRWHAATFLKEKLCLFPGKSLVHNIGNDNSGQHCVSTNVFSTQLATSPIALGDIPLVQSNEAREIIKSYYKSTKRSLLTRVISRASKIMFKKVI